MKKRSFRSALFGATALAAILSPAAAGVIPYGLNVTPSEATVQTEQLSPAQVTAQVTAKAKGVVQPKKASVVEQKAQVKPTAAPNSAPAVSVAPQVMPAMTHKEADRVWAQAVKLKQGKDIQYVWDNLLTMSEHETVDAFTDAVKGIDTTTQAKILSAMIVKVRDNDVPVAERGRRLGKLHVLSAWVPDAQIVAAPTFEAVHEAMHKDAVARRTAVQKQIRTVRSDKVVHTGERILEVLGELAAGAAFVGMVFQAVRKKKNKAPEEKIEPTLADAGKEPKAEKGQENKEAVPSKKRTLRASVVALLTEMPTKVMSYLQAIKAERDAKKEYMKQRVPPRKPGVKGFSEWMTARAKARNELALQRIIAEMPKKGRGGQILKKAVVDLFGRVKKGIAERKAAVAPAIKIQPRFNDVAVAQGLGTKKPEATVEPKIMAAGVSSVGKAKTAPVKDAQTVPQEMIGTLGAWMTPNVMEAVKAEKTKEASASVAKENPPVESVVNEKAKSYDAPKTETVVEAEFYETVGEMLRRQGNVPAVQAERCDEPSIKAYGEDVDVATGVVAVDETADLVTSITDLVFGEVTEKPREISPGEYSTSQAARKEYAEQLRREYDRDQIVEAIDQIREGMDKITSLSQKPGVPGGLTREKILGTMLMSEQGSGLSQKKKVVPEAPKGELMLELTLEQSRELGEKKEVALGAPKRELISERELEQDYGSEEKKEVVLETPMEVVLEAPMRELILEQTLEQSREYSM